MQQPGALESYMAFGTRGFVNYFWISLVLDKYVSIHMTGLANNTDEVTAMKKGKNKNNLVKEYNPTLSDLNKAAERQEFIDPEKGPENKGKKR